MTKVFKLLYFNQRKAQKEMKIELLKLAVILGMIAGLIFGATACYNTASIAIEHKNTQLKLIYNW